MAAIAAQGIIYTAFSNEQLKINLFAMIFSKSQVTLFMIIVFTICIAAAFLFYANSSKKIENKEKELTTAELLPVKLYTEACLRMVAVEGLFKKTGLHGGFIEPKGNPDYLEPGYSKEITALDGINLPVYSKTEDYPNLNLISQKLSNYIAVEIGKCLKYEEFEGIGIKIIKPETKETDADVRINEEDVSVAIQYPIIARIDKRETKINKFTVSLPIRLKQLYDGANYLIGKAESIAPPEKYDISKDCKLYDTNGKTNIYLKDDDSKTYKVVQFKDYSTFFESFIETYIFQFAVPSVVEGECK